MDTLRLEPDPRGYKSRLLKIMAEFVDVNSDSEVNLSHKIRTETQNRVAAVLEALDKVTGSFFSWHLLLPSADVCPSMSSLSVVILSLRCYHVSRFCRGSCCLVQNGMPLGCDESTEVWRCVRTRCRWPPSVAIVDDWAGVTVKSC